MSDYPTAVFFCMYGRGHFQRLRPLISGLAAEGMRVVVFTGSEFERDVASLGGRFVDLYGSHSVEDADADSRPVPVRSVVFAARFGEEISRAAAAFDPAVVVHDSFAVIGRVVATTLGLPRVNICAGHAQVPEQAVRALRVDPRVALSDRAQDAADELRARYGFEDASPFMYAASVSNDLNVYCEPPEFLDDTDRASFEPIAFYGSLPSDPPPASASIFPDAGLRVYVSFGTVVWTYFADQALDVLETISRAVAAVDDAAAVVSLGNGCDLDRARSVPARNVAVEPYVDQWSVLAAADLFITHQGLNSTHEAVYHGVPMISYPFVYADGPKLAAKCEALGIAIPLADAPAGAVDVSRVSGALQRVLDRRGSMAQALARAREWELDVIAGRPAIHASIRDLCARA